MNAIYAARMRTLIDRLKAGVPPGVQIPEQAGGLQLTIHWQQGPDDTRLVALLEAQGLCALPLSRLCHVQRRHGLVLGIGLVDADSIGPQASRLADLLKTLF
jgi:DNA-binding transcriptional MocR family regulator